MANSIFSATARTIGLHPVCDYCNSVHLGDCPTRSTLTELDPKAGVDQSSLSYTLLPVPAELTVKPSGIPGAGLGVFANKLIPMNVKMGPFEGKKVKGKDMDGVCSTEYAWEVECDGQSPYLIDASDPAHSNWMRFVNCARHEEEQNMAAFQFEGQIFYRSCKSVYPGSELLVWYGDQYASDLGILTAEKDGLSASHICLGCGTTFVVKKSLDVHIRRSEQCRAANPGTYQCVQCNEKFTILVDLQKHIKGHFVPAASTDSDFEVTTEVPRHNSKVCTYCGRSFSRTNGLSRHIRGHLGEKPFKCEQCGKCYARKENLRRHHLSHSGKKPYKCECCGKCFTDKDHLHHHSRVHANRPHKCEECGKRFKLKTQLEAHFRTHTGDKPYKCEHCGKGFSDYGFFTGHLRSHAGERPYKCRHCGKRFIWNSNLVQHMRTHSEDRPHKCELCGKCFSRKCHLEQHLWTHSEEKPFKCEKCGKGFCQKVHLQKHLKKH